MLAALVRIENHKSARIRAVRHRHWTCETITSSVWSPEVRKLDERPSGRDVLSPQRVNRVPPFPST